MFAWNANFSNGITHTVLSPISPSRIEMSVPILEGSVWDPQVTVSQLTLSAVSIQACPAFCCSKVVPDQQPNPFICLVGKKLSFLVTKPYRFQASWHHCSRYKRERSRSWFGWREYYQFSVRWGNLTQGSIYILPGKLIVGKSQKRSAISGPGWLSFIKSAIYLFLRCKTVLEVEEWRWSSSGPFNSWNGFQPPYTFTHYVDTRGPCTFGRPL